MRRVVKVLIGAFNGFMSGALISGPFTSLAGWMGGGILGGGHRHQEGFAGDTARVALVGASVVGASYGVIMGGLGAADVVSTKTILNIGKLVTLAMPFAASAVGAEILGAFNATSLEPLEATASITTGALMCFGLLIVCCGCPPNQQVRREAAVPVVPVPPVPEVHVVVQAEPAPLAGDNGYASLSSSPVAAPEEYYYIAAPRSPR